jgi:hypothetical protein
MKRNIDVQLFPQFQRDFEFLFDRIRKSDGELDLRLRDNYFNLYYKGNSLAKVVIKKNNYDVVIHSSFVKNTFSVDKRIPKPKEVNNYYKYTLTDNDLRQFFQIKHLNSLASNIKTVNNGEEITFEQMLITDNLQNPDIIIIDRQITETKLNRKRLDLLGLERVSNSEYRFLVLEVKLGNNKELTSDVGGQLKYYVDHIDREFDNWKNAYELVYAQIMQINIYPHLAHKGIKIVRPVKGRVVVGSYSGMARVAINELKLSYPLIDLKQFTFKL